MTLNIMTLRIITPGIKTYSIMPQRTMTLSIRILSGTTFGIMTFGLKHSHDETRLNDTQNSST
jgi:hypothetical protein